MGHLQSAITIKYLLLLNTFCCKHFSPCLSFSGSRFIFLPLILSISFSLSGCLTCCHDNLDQSHSKVLSTFDLMVNLLKRTQHPHIYTQTHLHTCWSFAHWANKKEVCVFLLPIIETSFCPFSHRVIHKQPEKYWFYMVWIHDNN